MKQQIHVPARAGRAFEVQAGDEIRITDLQGKQVCDLWAFHPENLEEFVSASHTRVACGRVILHHGDALVSNLRRPFLTLVDGVEGHDTLQPCCDPERYRLDYGIKDHHANCRENLYGIMQPYGLSYALVPDPINGVSAGAGHAGRSIRKRRADHGGGRQRHVARRGRFDRWCLGLPSRPEPVQRIQPDRYRY